MEDKDLEKPEAAEETAVQPEHGRALKEEPENEKKVLTPEEMEKRRKFIVIPAFVLVFLGVMYLSLIHILRQGVECRAYTRSLTWKRKSPLKR